MCYYRKRRRQTRLYECTTFERILKTKPRIFCARSKTSSASESELS